MRLRDFADSVRLGGLFCRGGVRCGWKGISIALTIHSLDRTYGMALRGARKIAIALVIHSADRSDRSWVSLRSQSFRAEWNFDSPSSASDPS